MSGTTSIGANGAVMVPTKRPRDTAIRQQRMKSWQPILDPYWVILAFAAIGVIFIREFITKSMNCMITATAS